jgi:integrase
MRHKRSLITRREGRPGWYENFTVSGHRFRDRLSDDEQEANRQAAERYAKALLGDLPEAKPAQQITTTLITRREGRPGWYENFTVSGHRFRDRLSDDEEEANRQAAERYAEAELGNLPEAKPVQQTTTNLTAAFARYWLEHAQHLPTADDIKRYGRMLEKGLGKETLLRELSEALLVAYVGQRRMTPARYRQTKLSPRSVNAEIEHLRAVMRRARDVWKVPVAEIEWSTVLLAEAGAREHILSRDDEEPRLWAELRADFHAMVLFALISGVRLANVIDLTWRQVDWEAGVIGFRIKSPKPGGELHYLPLTPALTAILSPERGRHPVRVFTYVCQRNRRVPQTGFIQQKGARYPFTHDGWRKEWKRALVAAAIEDFRFHDLRHTAATRALRAHKNLRAVQRMLGHKGIATTSRYAHSDLDDVRAAMEAVERAGLVNQSPPALVNKLG